MKQGYISQIIGPVVDVRFPSIRRKEQLPAINEALSIERDNYPQLIDYTE